MKSLIRFFVHRKIQHPGFPKQSSTSTVRSLDDPCFQPWPVFLNSGYSKIDLLHFKPIGIQPFLIVDVIVIDYESKCEIFNKLVKNISCFPKNISRS